MEKVRTNVNLTFLKAQKHLVLRSEYVIVPVQLERKDFWPTWQNYLIRYRQQKGENLYGWGTITCKTTISKSHVSSKIGLRVWNSHKVHIFLEYVPQCLSPRRNWDPPTPSLPSECTPHPGTKGEGGTHYTLACVLGGWGSPNADDWRNSLALCLLCACGHSPLVVGILLIRLICSLSACLP